MLPLLLLLPALSHCDRPQPQIVVQDEPSVDGLISTVLDGGGTFSDVPFADVINYSTGKLVIPLDPGDEAGRAILTGLRHALEQTLARYNQPGSPTSDEARINEVSSYFEEAIMEELNKEPGFSCDYPRTAEGNLQRSGYPDLRIEHEPSGRVIYLDPKLVKTGSFDSSLRTFYFTPKIETNKVLDNAHHLLVGIEHDGNTGDWRFLGWHLVDLSDFKVRLKAEFQASNKDLYLPELTIDRVTVEIEEREPDSP